MDKRVNVYLKKHAAAKIELEFTGRWRVIHNDSDSRLELECFALYPHEVAIGYEDIEYNPSWFQRLLGKKPRYTSDSIYIKKTKLIWNFGYVSTDGLVVEEVYNNVCGVDDDIRVR